MTRSHIVRCGLLGILIFFFVGYLPGLGSRPLIRPDEFRYAEIPREMRLSGDWTTPRFCGVRYFEKPALGYQFNAASFSLFGENAFALRWPSALAVLLTALFGWYFLNRTTRDPWLGTLAAGLYLGFGLVFGVGTFAVFDSQLTAALTICSGSFFLAWQERRRSRKFAFLALAGVAAGAGFLLKGGLALVIPSIIAVPFLLWQKEYRQIFSYPWIPLVFALATALPWSLAIASAEPDFWRYFIIEEHWNRFTGSTYDRGPEPFWYFLPVLLGGVLPTGLLALTVRLNKPAGLPREPLLRFLLCAAVIPFVFFSASSCKLGTYILP
ncbi:MAG: phospholipid carrier-dependent glycosyltransferase, partial [Victivallaceae bacterium]